MEARRFVLLDPDPGYVERFLEYVQRKPNFLFSVLGCTGMESLVSLLEGSPAELALVDEDLWGAAEPALQRQVLERLPCLVLLADRRRSGEELRSVCRYQSMEQLLPEILRIYEEAVPKVTVQEERTQLDVFYSPDGGELRSLWGRLLGHRLAEQSGRTVLYISLEALAGDGQSRAGLSDLLYYRANGNLRMLQSLTHSEGALSVLDPVMNPEDMWKLSGEELAGILEEIRQMGLYDTIIVDLAPDRDPLPVLDLGRRVFLIQGEGPCHRERMDHFLEYAGQKAGGGLPENWHRLTPEDRPAELRSHETSGKERTTELRRNEALEEWLEKEWLAWA